MAIQSGELSVSLKTKSTGTNDFGGPAFAPVMSALLQFTVGTGANQFDLEFFDERSIATGADDDIDLAGVLTDEFGTVITYAEIMLIAIFNRPRTGSPNTTTLTIGGGTNPFVGFLSGTAPKVTKLGPGGGLLLWNPDATGLGAVGAGASDILRITNSAGATAKVQVGVLGRSA